MYFYSRVIGKQEIQVPQESLESHDTDEMDMSDDDEAANLRYGKRSRFNSKVSIFLFLSTKQDKVLKLKTVAQIRN